MVKFFRILILLIVDILIINVSYITSFLIRFDFDVNSAIFESWFSKYADNIIQITVITIIAFAAFSLYTSMWRYAGTEELYKIVLASALASLLVLAYVFFLGPR